ncbi:DUF460 domain-containing protein [Halocatena pleomorpha]|uniref:DUF460 domain-containing protein n=1 Tax=Halocatena pleomorpha TaxID=1785090 RepID=A0A3P3RBD7_9EURY|nr:DUF460 domain-containing protein [Halocatena pleomorpha]RRJ30782.1 DUF460 domain-containing protein [Halocatena pleomorpha]
MNTRASALDAVVFGVDIQSGDVRGDAPSYAVVAFDGEQIDRDVVSFRKLRRLIAREEPAIVATDNTYELAADKDALVQLLRELPAETKLVQVTGAQRPEPLSRVASRHGVPYGKKPMKEAEAAARLAAANVGQEVRAFSDTTTVKVARGRSTGNGGWSEDRYTRRIHGAVKTTARDVESELRDAGLDFDVERTEKYGGLSRAVFTVESRPEEIPVSRMRSGDVRIEIERERRDGIEYQPLAKRRDHVLVGIDPGTTTGIAIVGLGGTVLDVSSTRTGDTADVIEWIIERGQPIVVAADVTPIPETVEKIRRSFDAAAWTPERDLPIDRKQHRTRENSYDNDHERDAMAAALFAFDDHEDQFERIARKIPAQLDRGTVTARVVAGEESVETVVADLTDNEESSETDTTDDSPERSPEEKEIKRLNERIERLESHIETLEETIDSKDDRIAEYERKLSDARRAERRKARKNEAVTRLERKTEQYQQTIERQSEEIDTLDNKLERLKELWKIDHSNFADVSEEKQGLTPVKTVDQFTMRAIKRADEQYGLIPDDVILLRDASGAGKSTAQRLADCDPRLVLREGGLSDIADEVLFDHDIPIAPAETVTIQEIDELAVAREQEISAAVEEWHKRARDRKRSQKSELVDKLISEHRANHEPERGEPTSG